MQTGKSLYRFLCQNLDTSKAVDTVNYLGKYGEWCNNVSYNMADIDGMIAEHK